MIPCESAAMRARIKMNRYEVLLILLWPLVALFLF